MARDYSGYGEACRHDVGALVSAGVEVTTQIPSYVLESTDFGKVGALCNALENKPLGYKIKILHTTPNVYTQFMEPNIYHIARAFWETNKLPPDFVQGINLCNEVWTGSEYNAQAMRDSGVTKPIYIIPEAIDTDIGEVEPYITNVTAFTFYSIFEWTERKNPLALLTAYWQEFTPKDNVALVLKTYVDNFQSSKRDEVNSYIKRIKKQMPLPYYAPLYLYRNLMDRRQMYRFHKTFDCFISTHRGEGWGVPQMEALTLNKPIISTNCGGIHEYLTDKQDALLLPFKLTNVDNTRNKQWYLPDQKWASVDIEALRKTMRFAFDNQKDMQLMGTKGAQLVQNTFALKVVGNKMLERLKVIQGILEPQI